MTAHILQCVWPIIDEHRTRTELIAEATDDLERLADQANAIITGPPIWYIADAAETPGWTGYAPGMVLVANLPAEPYGAVWEHRDDPRVIDGAVVERLIAGNPPAEVRPTERTAAMAAMAARGVDIEAIASRFKVQPDSVKQAVTRTRRREKELVAA